MPRRVTLPTLLLALAAGGCGPSYHPVNGIVKHEGSPVEGATVNLVSEDGSKTYTGFTAADGTFSITSGPKPGALAGNYKVTVVKTKVVPGGEKMAPGGADYMKHMQKEQKADATPGGGTPMGPMNKAMMKTAAGGGNKNETELPQAYSSVASTPLTAKVPVDGGQLVLNLKGK